MLLATHALQIYCNVLAVQSDLFIVLLLDATGTDVLPIPRTTCVVAFLAVVTRAFPFCSRFSRTIFFIGMQIQQSYIISSTKYNNSQIVFILLILSAAPRVIILALFNNDCLYWRPRRKNKQVIDVSVYRITAGFSLILYC